MYLYHFGLREFPFTITPNTSFFIALESHNEAFAVLNTALKTGEGFIKVVGEVGTGKTLLCRKLLNEISPHFFTAYIPNPYLAPDELRRAVAVELGVNNAQKITIELLTQKIQERLLMLHSEGRSVVLILDEAQAIPEESLEVLRLFTNLETETRKLLQVILFAQPELDERLNERKFRQLKQRITFSYYLRKMNCKEVGGYINQRLAFSGAGERTIFNDGVIKKIYKVTGGTPRLVNILCHKMLMLCYGEGKFVITKKHLKLAIDDTDSVDKLNVFNWYVICLIILAVISFIFIYILLENNGMG